MNPQPETAPSYWRFLGCSPPGSVSELQWLRQPVILKRPTWQEAECWLQLCCDLDVTGCIPHSQLRLLLETSVYGLICGIFHNCLFGKHPAEDGNFGRVGHSWVGAEWLLEQFFFGLPGAGTSVWTVYRLPFPHLYLGEMSWWARRWSACCSHQEGWPVDGFLYVVHLPSARRDPVQAHAVSPLPLPSMGVWLPGHLQGQRDGFAASPGGLFGVEVPATPFFLPLRCLGSVPC